MSSKSPNADAVSEMLGLHEKAPAKPEKIKFGSSKAAKSTKSKKGPRVEEEDDDAKHNFSSRITTANKRRFANYQANKPGRKGTGTTEVLNAALTMFFDANKKYADKDPDEED